MRWTKIFYIASCALALFPLLKLNHFSMLIIVWLLLAFIVALKNKSKKTIVSSSYAETFGTPVLFDKKHFEALLSLKGNEGAKKLLGLLKDEMISLPFKKGSWDIDTEADYTKLIND